MDISYTSEFDAKRYEAYIRRALGLKASVSFGRNKFELDGVAPREEKTERFFVGGDCACRVVATLADGLVVSNSYGYYCYGMDCGVIRVTVTEDRRVKIADKYYKYDPHYD